MESRAAVPKVSCTVPWGRWDYLREALEVGPSERVIRLFTTEVTSD
jgi:hypothetical protein